MRSKRACTQVEWITEGWNTVIGDYSQARLRPVRFPRM
jgi:hypothetical protein